MGIFSDEIQRTSVSLYIERLSNLDQVDWYLFEQLVESIQMQENGAREAIETIRKKLKHGDTRQKLRVIEILQLSLENTGQQLYRQLVANEKMPERIEIIFTSSSENPAVKKALVSLLGTCVKKYKHEPGTRVIADLFDLGVNNGHRSRPIIMDNTPQTSLDRSPSPVRNQGGGRNRSASNAAVRPQHTETTINTRPRSKSNAPVSEQRTTTTFNFEKVKPKILEEIALGNSNANNLVNALKLINTSEDRWEIELQHDKRVQDYHNKCEESKRKIVRYARLVENDEWIGTLLSTNEELLKALEMYDIMMAGEVPAMWHQQQLLYETRRLPPSAAANDRLSLEDSFSRQLQISKKEEEDPFADPTTPIDERREYIM